MEKVQTNEKLIELRKILNRKGLDALVIPHSDAHDNEYLASSDERVKFISNFAGSNALCLVTQSDALCWTDGRYFIACEQQLYPGWKMMKMGRGEKTLREFVKENLPKNSKIGVDFSLISNDSYNRYAELTDYSIINDSPNSIDELWGNERPQYKKDKVIIHDVKYTGETCLEKYNRVYSTFLSKSTFSDKATAEKIAILIVKLDDIAWISNLRGQDIEFNPVFFSYAILYHDTILKSFKLHIFSDVSKFDSKEINKHLVENNITLFSYDSIFSRLSNFSDLKNVESENLVNELKQYVLIADAESANQKVFELIKNSNDQYKFFIDSCNFVEHTKYIKNSTEIKGMKESHIRDGAALVRYFAWLENELIKNKNTNLNEFQAAQKSVEFRKVGKLFMGESFECISSSGANAAIIHYKPDENTSSIIDRSKVYLCDSGAQYLDGTTDTTRTLFFDDDIAKDTNNLKKEKEMYTRVLLGNLAIERSKFMKRWNLSGSSVDSIARHSLWHVGEDYMHGTGHGVGHFLNVHEGPNGIGGYPGNPNFVKGMVMSNEPGYYLKDHFGIRIENVIGVEEVNGSSDLLCFDNFTTVPYEKNLLDLNLLSNDYIGYINSYHERVYNDLLPLLQEYDDEQAIEYLKKKTSPIPLFKF